jgi:hypothetical protein
MEEEPDAFMGVKSHVGGVEVHEVAYANRGE